MSSKKSGLNGSTHGSKHGSDAIPIARSTGKPRKVGVNGNPIGRPCYKPTKKDGEKVKRLCLLGLPEREICKYIGPEGIALDTLRLHFKEDLRSYRQERLSKLAGSVYQRAMKDKTLAMFTLKCQAGWRETSNVELGGEVIVVKRVIGVKEEDV